MYVNWVNGLNTHTSVTVDIRAPIVLLLFAVSTSLSLRTITLVAMDWVRRTDLVSGTWVLITTSGVGKAVIT